MTISDLAISCTLKKAELEQYLKLDTDGSMYFTPDTRNGKKANTVLSPNAPTVLVAGVRYTTSSIKNILGYEGGGFKSTKTNKTVSQYSNLSSSFTLDRTLNEPAITIFKSETMFALLFENTLTLHKSSANIHGLTFKHDKDKIQVFKLTEL